MSMYPSLEDLKVDQMMRAQIKNPSQVSNVAPNAPPAILPFSQQPAHDNSIAYNGNLEHLYPGLNDYMGLSLSSEEMAMLQQSEQQIAVRQTGQIIAPNNQGMIAPISSSSLGLQRAQVTHGLREVTLCKDKNGVIGLRVRAINKGVFIVFVHVNSPAAMVGLRFGDQILQIDDHTVAGYSTEKVHDIFKKGPSNNIRVIVRDRPFERTITLHKDSTGHTGFCFKGGKINAIVKDSSAARNGLLIDHNMLEVNGQNVVGLDDKQVRKIIESSEDCITLTIMPSSIFDHMMKQMSSSLVKKLMDHSIPDV